MTEPTDFKTGDAASYDKLADKFDYYTERVSTYAVDELLDAVETAAGDVLDIGCGTGVVTLAAARKAAGGRRVIGVDLSDGMIEVARRKASGLGLSGAVSFEIGDAEKLSFAGASIGAAVSLYAFRHFPHPDKAFAEAFRVVKPGGRIAVAVGSGPALLSMSGLRAAAQRLPRLIAQRTGRELAACEHIDGLVHEFLPSPADKEVAEWTTHHHGYSGPMAALARQAGFVVEREWWAGRQYEFASAEEFWELQSTFSSIARKRLQDAAPADAEKLRERFFAQCDAVLARGGRLVYRVGAAFVAARKP
jgi:ubiquinone/menaquinone biosynthesis C-methylase UbiE